MASCIVDGNSHTILQFGPVIAAGGGHLDSVWQEFYGLVTISPSWLKLFLHPTSVLPLHY